MALETGNYITDLVITNPTGGDPKSQGDDHLRLVKKTVKQTFPNLNAPVTVTPTELNYLSGVTSNIQTQINNIGTSIVDDNTNTTNYLLFASGTGSQSLKADITTGPLTYNPSTGQITANGDVTVNGVSVGRGAASVATNVRIGNGSLGAITTGSGNIAIGDAVLNSITTNTQNVAIGSNALTGLAAGAGSQNVAIGHNAYRGAGGGSNICIGTNAGGGSGNTATSQNTIIGGQSATVIAGGANNACLGFNSLQNITTGSNNFAVGFQSGADAVRNISTTSNEGVLGNNNITGIFAKVSITATSDVRDKTLIAPVPLGLSFIQSINPIGYRFRTSREDETPVGRRIYGFSAQELLPLQGEASIVDATDPENLKLNATDLIAVLVNAVKELAAEVEALKAA